MIKFAGGKKANYVCFSQSEKSVGARKLKEHGCKNVFVHVLRDDLSVYDQGHDSLLLKKSSGS